MSFQIFQYKLDWSRTSVLTFLGPVALQIFRSRQQTLTIYCSNESKPEWVWCSWIICQIKHMLQNTK